MCIFLNFTSQSMCVGVHVGIEFCRILVEILGQQHGLGSLLPPLSELQGHNSGLQRLPKQGPLTTEVSC